MFFFLQSLTKTQNVLNLLASLSLNEEIGLRISKSKATTAKLKVLKTCFYSSSSDFFFFFCKLIISA